MKKAITPGMMALVSFCCLLGYIIPFRFDRPRLIRLSKPVRPRNDEMTNRLILK